MYNYKLIKLGNPKLLEHNQKLKTQGPDLGYLLQADLPYFDL